MHGPRCGDDEMAVEEADRGGAAVLAPGVGGDGLDDRGDELLAALALDLCGCLSPAGAGEDRLPTAAPAATCVRLIEVEFGRLVEVGDVKDEVAHGVDLRDQLLVGQLACRDLHDTL